MTLVFTRRYISDPRYLSGDPRCIDNIFGCSYEVKESELSIFVLENSEYIFEIKTDLIKVIFEGSWIESTSKNFKFKMDILLDFSESGCEHHVIRSDKIFAFFTPDKFEIFKNLNIDRWNKLVDNGDIQIIEKC